MRYLPKRCSVGTVQPQSVWVISRPRWDSNIHSPSTWSWCPPTPRQRIRSASRLRPEWVHRELNDPIWRAGPPVGVVPLAGEKPHPPQRRPGRDVTAVGLGQPVVVRRRQAFGGLGPVVVPDDGGDRRAAQRDR